METTLILSNVDVMNKIRRIAYEMRERFLGCNQLVFVDIKGEGSVVSELIKAELQSISDIHVSSMIAHIDKRKPDMSKVRLETNPEEISGSICVVIDDVINSGRTLMYVCSSIIAKNPKQLTTAVIIDRFHRTYPIKADFVGVTLSTNIKEHVNLKSSTDGLSVWLEG